MIQTKVQKFLKPFQFNHKPKLTDEQRLKNKSAYLKRRLTRLSKRASWLKRKNFKRLKRIRKQRRHLMVLNKYQTYRILVRCKKIHKIVYSSFTHKFISTAAKLPKFYNPNLNKYKISQYKTMFTQHTDKFKYFLQ